MSLNLVPETPSVGVSSLQMKKQFSYESVKTVYPYNPINLQSTKLPEMCITVPTQE